VVVVVDVVVVVVVDVVGVVGVVVVVGLVVVPVGDEGFGAGLGFGLTQRWTGMRTIRP
jgi:hypothetical protein